MPHMYHPELGKSVPVPNDDRELMKLKYKGYFAAESLVDTSTGSVFNISIEAQVENGQGVIRALQRVRGDEGHEGQPAFMSPAQWERLPQKERAAYLKAEKPRDASHGGTAALAAKVAEQEAELAALRKQAGKAG